jgi:glycosyltransferase involved in cell wall biosynthesis
MTRPLLFVGDSPSRKTGLARILRELAICTWNDQASLGLSVAVAGWDEEFIGSVGGPPTFKISHAGDDWGSADVSRVWETLYGRQPGILWTVWDPSRCFPYAQIPLPVSRWGYFAIDAHDPHGRIGGPAAAAVRSYDRVLAYTRYGATVLSQTLGRDVPHLPHGLDPIFAPETEHQPTFGPYYEPGCTVIGCVAANQPRKDLGLFFATLAELRRRGRNVYGWLHTDQPIFRAWSVPQLVETFGLTRHVWVTTDLTDVELAAHYTACDMTIAPGLGEGFGYPIVESMACGTPVIHGTYGGGAELVPDPHWRFPQVAERLESVYALIRPVFKVDDVANAAESVLNDLEAAPRQMAAYCQGAVGHLKWADLWPRWRQWIQDGVERFPNG